MNSQADFRKSFELAIEILANLVFLTKLEAADQEKVAEYMRLAERQLTELAELALASDEADGGG